MSFLTNNYPDFIPSNTTSEENTEIIILKDSAPGFDNINVKIFKQAEKIVVSVFLGLKKNF